MLRSVAIACSGGIEADNLNNFMNLIPPTDSIRSLRTLYGELKQYPLQILLSTRGITNKYPPQIPFSPC